MSDKPSRVFGEDDSKEFKEQVNAEPDLWRIYAEAMPCKVKIENEVFPRPHEVYNCTSCKHGGPNINPDKERFYNRCQNPQSQTFGRWMDGGKWNDIGCPWFFSKIERPKHGFMPGIESGPYIGEYWRK